jgi:hypothetical protein
VSHLLLLPIILTLNINTTSVRGQYVEARTCDVYTGTCFANADTGLIGKHGILAWKFESGTVKGTKIDGLGVVAVVAARETLGLKQSGPGRGIVIVDEKATRDQREALVAFAKAQAGDLLGEVIAVRSASFDLVICHCDGETCATLKAGDVKLATKCIDADHDKACGNDDTIYPPLAKGVAAKAAMTIEHSYSGKDLKETWSDAGRRGAFVGTFLTR